MSSQTNFLRAILVIEDSQSLQENYQELLEFAGYKTYLVGNANEALHILNDDKITPDLIITDVVMPGMDGLELFKTVRSQARWQHIPFLFISGNLEMLEAIKASGDLERMNCLFKPFAINELLDMIAQVL